MTRRMTCRDIAERADTVLGGDTSCPEWESLREHLSLCPPCMEYVRQIGLTVEMVQKLPCGAGEATKAALLECYEKWLKRSSKDETS
jgi:hypothetical protein